VACASVRRKHFAGVLVEPGLQRAFELAAAYAANDHGQRASFVVGQVESDRHDGAILHRCPRWPGSHEADLSSPSLSYGFHIVVADVGRVLAPNDLAQGRAAFAASRGAPGWASTPELPP